MTGRRNSVSSSSSSTPSCARLISPGRGGWPPPSRPAALMLACTDRMGGCWLRRAGCPQAERMAAMSKACAAVSGGRMPGRRRASMLLPVPGEPHSSSGCRPAAAISSARRASAWPCTSARSGGASGAAGLAVPGSRSSSSRARASRVSPRRWAMTAARVGAPYSRCRPLGRASARLASGRMRVCSGALVPMPAATASAARIGRSSPDSDSSPTSSRSCSASGGISPAAAAMPMAMGRSKRPDSLGRSAGARLTVMRRLGNSTPLCRSAARTRSRLSRTDTSGSPTMLKAGRPLARCTSTETGGAVRPSSARLCTTARAFITRWSRRPAWIGCLCGRPAGPPGHRPGRPATAPGPPGCRIPRG